ncbi:MAG: DUF1501 domain-containing protein [Planctomycetales bacterium]|nr:DUF1501 domain-containing protein [Planctomycetales bacterium]
MLTIVGKQDGRGAHCDRRSRRSFLTIGGMAMGGLTLSQLLAAEAQAGVGRSHKAVINIFLPGGPPHQDMWDIKEDAPVEIRGEFKSIATNVPGIRVGELFPNIAAMMDKFVPIRSMVGAGGGHDAYQCMHGRRLNSRAPSGGWPMMGSWISKTLGQVDQAVPANASLMYTTDHKEWGDAGGGGFLGLPHAPFRLVGGKGEGAGSKNENMVLRGITPEGLQDRRSLLNAFDRLRRDIDTTGRMTGYDAFTDQAVGILTSSKLVEAMDLSKEDPKIVERYGKGDPEFRADGAPKVTENFCVARRLIEAGARCVSLNFSRWDWHGENFQRARQDMPMLDRAVAALVKDLDERGMLRDVAVVVWGEFGRTPKINDKRGRDHWPQVSCALLAGGGMRTGQVIGATNRLGETAADRPVEFQEVHATLYTCLGLDVKNVRIFDLQGRPNYLVDPGYEPMRELL